MAENSTFKLYYFDIQALAEPIRYIFAYAGQKYEDVRVGRDEWVNLKSSECNMLNNKHFQKKNWIICRLFIVHFFKFKRNFFFGLLVLAETKIHI